MIARTVGRVIGDCGEGDGGSCKDYWIIGIL